MVGARVHRLDLQDRVDHGVERLPAADRVAPFCQATIASQARASMSSGNSWTIVSRPCRRSCLSVLVVAAVLVEGLQGVEVELLARESAAAVRACAPP